MKILIIGLYILLNLPNSYAEEVNILGIIVGEPTCNQLQTKVQKSLALEKENKDKLQEMEIELEEKESTVNQLELNLKIYDKLTITENVFQDIFNEYKEELTKLDKLIVKIQSVKRREEIRIIKFKLNYVNFRYQCIEKEKELY